MKTADIYWMFDHQSEYFIHIRPVSLKAIEFFKRYIKNNDGAGTYIFIHRHQPELKKGKFTAGPTTFTARQIK